MVPTIPMMSRLASDGISSRWARSSNFRAASGAFLLVEILKKDGHIEHLSVVFRVRQAKPLRSLEPGSVGAWHAVPQTQRRDPKWLDYLKTDR
jgi:hypothetical protein